MQTQYGSVVFLPVCVLDKLRTSYLLLLNTHNSCCSQLNTRESLVAPGNPRCKTKLPLVEIICNYPINEALELLRVLNTSSVCKLLVSQIFTCISKQKIAQRLARILEYLYVGTLVSQGVTVVVLYP